MFASTCGVPPMSHTIILLSCLAFGWGVAARVLRLAAHFERWGDGPTSQGRAWGAPALVALGAAVVLPFVTTWVLGTLTHCLH